FFPGSEHCFSADSLPPRTPTPLPYTTLFRSYWQQVRAAQIAEGTATNYGPEMVSKGDAVKISGQWVRVARANAKSVSVEILIRPETGYTVTHRAPWAHVQDHRQQ